jgi:hypothetical protein
VKGEHGENVRRIHVLARELVTEAESLSEEQWKCEWWIVDRKRNRTEHEGK